MLQIPMLGGKVESSTHVRGRLVPSCCADRQGFIYQAKECNGIFQAQKRDPKRRRKGGREAFVLINLLSGRMPLEEGEINSRAARVERGTLQQQRSLAASKTR